jgi:hypothetical protein
VERLIHSGWVLLAQHDNEDSLKKERVQLNIEGESTLLLDASFKGEPVDISDLFGSLDQYSNHYALDLFGDSARLVRRFIK